MIQRIQTIYLLLAAIAMMTVLAIPIAYSMQDTGTMVDLYISENMPAMILAFLSAVASLVGIVLFKNRKLQMRVALVAMAFSMFALAAICFFDFFNKAIPVTSVNYVALFMPVFSLIFNSLGYRGIQSDEKLVRSMDRLR